jgi:hypothetical protein
MYGLVNRAIEELVTERAGRPTWEAVKRRAGVTAPGFVSMDPYPDSLTHDLVVAASELLGQPPETLLRALGHYWILFTARGDYGALFDMAGDSLHDFLAHLDAMHSRLATIMPELVPPSFSVRPERGGTLRVRYESPREGLAPMVVGLLEGLAEFFESDASVEHVVVRGEGVPADEFLLVLAKGSE